MPSQTQTIVDYLNHEPVADEQHRYETVHFGFQHERHVASANRYQVEGAPDYPEEDWVNRDAEWAERAVDGAVAYLGHHQGNRRPFYMNVGTVEVHASRWEGDFPEGHPQNRADLYRPDPVARVTVPPWLPDTRAQRERLGSSRAPSATWTAGAAAVGCCRVDGV